MKAKTSGLFKFNPWLNTLVSEWMLVVTTLGVMYMRGSGRDNQSYLPSWCFPCRLSVIWIHFIGFPQKRHPFLHASILVDGWMYSVKFVILHIQFHICNPKNFKTQLHMDYCGKTTIGSHYRTDNFVILKNISKFQNFRYDTTMVFCALGIKTMGVAGKIFILLSNSVTVGMTTPLHIWWLFEVYLESVLKIKFYILRFIFYFSLKHYICAIGICITNLCDVNETGASFSVHV